MSSLKIAPSFLSADFANLGREVQAITAAGADYLHFDVMDGHFVPNLTFGPGLLKALRPYSTLPFDVHLMISPVDPFLEAFIQAGADILTLHPEAGPHVHRSLQYIRKLGKKTGIALNPSTPLEMVDYLLDDVNQIVIMTVNPGFGGQTFISSQLEKIKQVKQKIHKRPIDIQVDGGINPEMARAAVQAGANILVAGSAVFKNGQYLENIQALRRAALHRYSEDHLILL